MTKNKLSSLGHVVPSLALALAAGSMGISAHAVERVDATSGHSMGYLGFLAGGNNATASSVGATPTFGGTLGFKLAPDLGIGLLGSYYGQTSSGSLLGLPYGTSTGTLLFAAQLNFFLGGFHIGGEIGEATSTWSGNISNVHTGSSTTALVVGPTVGFDFLLGRSVSLGAEGHYLFTNADSGVNNVQLFAALKVWQ